MRVTLVLLASLALACGGSGSDRVIVLGLDGMDPEIVDLLMSEGKLPNFARLRQQGAYGRLRSSEPMFSPILWTTIATGKPPLEHGISDFVAVNEKTGQNLPATSQMRQVKSIWNLLSDVGREVAVVGWWATWPAEAVNGTIVSDHTCYHFLFPDEERGARDAVGVMHPPGLESRLGALIRRPGDVTRVEAARFVDVPAEEFTRPFAFDDDVSHFKWALATAETYRAIGLRLWHEQSPDLLMVYIEGVDSTSHLFGHLFRQASLAGHLGEQQKRFGRAVEEMYVYADEIVGDYLEAMDERTTLVVLSDHGFELGALHDDPSKARDLRRVSARFHRIEGILYLYGNRVRAGRRLEQPTLLDVTPTLLALSGLPPAQDMPGRVLSEAIDLPPELPDGRSGAERRVATYETGERGLGTVAADSDATVDPRILERLRSLGYLDTTAPKGDRNLAAMHFSAGEYEKAVALYSELVEKEPEDGELRASLAGALGALGRLDESLEQLDRALELEPANPGAYHNRGMVFEIRGDARAAVREYRRALSFEPDNRPAREALLRLAGPGALGNEAGTAERKLAAALAERAHEAALRGEYERAMAKLDEAESIAPDFARVHHYRSNVAYLMGDRARAIAALRRAVELEPGNPLFRTNLERLEKRSLSK